MPVCSRIGSVLGFLKFDIFIEFFMFYIISFEKETVIFLPLPSLLSKSKRSAWLVLKSSKIYILKYFPSFWALED